MMNLSEYYVDISVRYWIWCCASLHVIYGLVLGSTFAAIVAKIGSMAGVLESCNQKQTTLMSTHVPTVRKVLPLIMQI